MPLVGVYSPCFQTFALLVVKLTQNVLMWKIDKCQITCERLMGGGNNIWHLIHSILDHCHSYDYGSSDFCQMRGHATWVLHISKHGVRLLTMMMTMTTATMMTTMMRMTMRLAQSVCWKLIEDIKRRLRPTSPNCTVQF